MGFEDKNISPELREKAAECKTTEELVALAKQEGYELSDEELEAISGGWSCSDYCGSYCTFLGMG